MAEIAVNIVIDKLIPLLGQEVESLTGLRGELERIKDDLESIQSSLRDADGKAENNESVKTWAKQLRLVSFNMEDVIDEFQLHSATQGADDRPRGFIGSLQKAVHYPIEKKMKLEQRHEIANQIQHIRKQVCHIKERRDAFSFRSSEQGSSSGTVQNVTWHDPRRASLFIKETELVGIEVPKKKLLCWLLEGESKQGVISVVGMGGLGKTTLAKKAFDSQDVKGHFDCNVWITVSQSYKMEEILRKTMKQFKQASKEEYEEIDKMEEEQLIGKLQEYLLQKKYLVVFDDVWAIDFWGVLKFALPSNAKGSRVIITTRSGDVASSTSCEESSTHVLELQPLPSKKAWELFCKKVFRSDSCPEELEELAHEIVNKCRGLPLAIVVIGGLLSRKGRVASEWKTFHDSLRFELDSNRHLESITRILLLSYYDLPYYLKSCFLYLGIFPEDYRIRRRRLIRLWIAEGFVKETEGKTVEDIAEEYFNELTQRRLVLIPEVDFDGRARECQVHDLIRVIILSKYNELNFCCVLEKNKKLSFDGLMRRLSMHDYEMHIPESTNFSKVRSISLFGVNDLVKQLTGTILTNCRLLKVLDFEDARSLENVPEEVGNLFHLRYLSVRNTSVRTLPRSIGKLHNLETLDLRRCAVNELPVEILGLHKLRHLLAYRCEYSTVGLKMPEGVGSLEALQKLSYVGVNQSESLLGELKKLRQLRKLGVLNLKREDGIALGAAVENMNLLLSLAVCSIDSGEEVLDIQSISSPPPLLQRLRLFGRLDKLPDWISKLRNLLRICLGNSRLLDDPLQLLQALPNLLELVLVRAYEGNQLHFEASGFPKLKVLILYEMDRPCLAKIDHRALPVLEELDVVGCEQLRAQGIRDLTSLREYQQRHGGPN